MNCKKKILKKTFSAIIINLRLKNKRKFPYHISLLEFYLKLSSEQKFNQNVIYTIQNKKKTAGFKLFLLEGRN